MRFRDRFEAGLILAQKLKNYAGENTVVLALPRGGVEIGFEVARVLHAPLDILIARKLGVPGHPELAFGAVAQGGVRAFNESVIRQAGLSEEDIAFAVENEQAEVERRLRQYRGDRPLPDLHGKTVILVDDGLATGATALAAIQALKEMKPARIVLAVPVAAPSTVERLKDRVDEVVCVETPEQFMAVGLWYQTFSQVSDREVIHLLEQAQATPRRPVA